MPDNDVPLRFRGPSGLCGCYFPAVGNSEEWWTIAVSAGHSYGKPPGVTWLDGPESEAGRATYSIPLPMNSWRIALYDDGKWSWVGVINRPYECSEKEADEIVHQKSIDFPELEFRKMQFPWEILGETSPSNPPTALSVPFLTREEIETSQLVCDDNCASKTYYRTELSRRNSQMLAVLSKIAEMERREHRYREMLRQYGMRPMPAKHAFRNLTDEDIEDFLEQPATEQTGGS